VRTSTMPDDDVDGMLGCERPRENTSALVGVRERCRWPGRACVERDSGSGARQVGQRGAGPSRAAHGAQIFACPHGKDSVRGSSMQIMQMFTDWVECSECADGAGEGGIVQGGDDGETEESENTTLPDVTEAADGSAAIAISAVVARGQGRVVGVFERSAANELLDPSGDVLLLTVHSLESNAGLLVLS
jgi:hypothetical protein